MADDSDSETEIEDVKVTAQETHGDEMLSINSVMVKKYFNAISCTLFKYIFSFKGKIGHLSNQIKAILRCI